MKTYNFIVFQGGTNFHVDVNAESDDEAIDLLRKDWPESSGWNFVLI